MIRIDDDFVINIDQDNYVACVDKHKQWIDSKGRIKNDYDTIGYYTSLYTAIQGIIDYKVRKSLGDGEKSLYEAVECLKMANEEFLRQFRKAIGDGKE